MRLSVVSSMEWPGHLAMLGAFLLLCVWTAIISYLVYKYRTRGKEGRCIEVTPPPVKKTRDTDISQVEIREL